MTVRTAVASTKGRAARAFPWSAQKIHESLLALMGDKKIEVYPLTGESKPSIKRTTIEMPSEMAEEIDLVSDLWNELDGELDIEREKWVPARVIRRFNSIGLDLFWEQVGGRPATKEGRKAAVQRAIEHLKSAKK